MQISCGFPGRPGDLVAYGPTLPVRIGFDPVFSLGRGQVNLPPQLHNALVDTGAYASCIDSELAAVLDLPIINQQPVAGIHGTETVNMHLAQIEVPRLNLTIPGRFAGVHLTAGGQPHRAIIGRTFLRGMRLSYDGSTGEVTLERLG